MERVQELIDKLYQQRQNNVGPEHLMATVQQLHDVLMAATQEDISFVSEKVAVRLPSKFRVTAKSQVAGANPTKLSASIEPVITAPEPVRIPEVKPVAMESFSIPQAPPEKRKEELQPSPGVVVTPPPRREEYMLQKPMVTEMPPPKPTQPEPQAQLHAAYQPQIQPEPQSPPQLPVEPEPQPVAQVQSIPLQEPQLPPQVPVALQPEPQPIAQVQPQPQAPPPPQHQPNLFGLHFDAVEEAPTLMQQGPKPAPKEIHELISEPKESLNDRLKQDRPELSHVLKDTPIKDLRKAIGINDKFLFVNELFRGDEAMYERSIKTINGFHIFPEAEYWINRELKVKLGWLDSSPTVKLFYNLVRRRFS